MDQCWTRFLWHEYLKLPAEVVVKEILVGEWEIIPPPRGLARVVVITTNTQKPVVVAKAIPIRGFPSNNYFVIEPRRWQHLVPIHSMGPQLHLEPVNDGDFKLTRTNLKEINCLMASLGGI
jgi:hypothetical protein